MDNRDSQGWEKHPETPKKTTFPFDIPKGKVLYSGSNPDSPKENGYPFDYIIPPMPPIPPIPPIPPPGGMAGPLSFEGRSVMAHSVVRSRLAMDAAF